MKGLLRKDFYMAWKYCKAYLFIIVVFVFFSYFGSDNTFFLFYPAILCGMIPVTLIAYEERCKWTVYSETLPLSRTQIVSSKYFLVLIGTGVVAVLTGIVQGVGVYIGRLHAAEYISLMATLLVAALFIPSFTLPLIFKFGSEKARIANFVLIGVACGITAISSLTESLSLPRLPLLSTLAIGAAMFALSWFLSVLIYKKREL